MMLGRLKSILGKVAKATDESASVVRLESVHKWLRGQMNESFEHHKSMLETLFNESKQRYDKLDEACAEFAEAAIRNEDFPDAPSMVIKYKDKTLESCEKHLEEIKKIIEQKASSIEDYIDKYAALEKHLNGFEKELSMHGKTLKTYYLDHMHAVQQAVKDIRQDLANAQDILTSPLLKRFAEVREHIADISRKKEQLAKVHSEMQIVQDEIDIQYKEYLRFEGKVKEIRTSKRYQMELDAPRGPKKNAVGHFSVMDHEIKELTKRKEQIREELEGLKERKQEFYELEKKLAITPHIERLEQILTHLVHIEVEIVDE